MEDEALDRWYAEGEGDRPGRPSRQMGLTQEQRNFLARYLRQSRKATTLTPPKIMERVHQAWLTGRPDPSLPELVVLE